MFKLRRPTTPEQAQIRVSIIALNDGHVIYKDMRKPEERNVRDSKAFHALFKPA